MLMKSNWSNREPAVCPQCGDPRAERLLYMERYGSITDWFLCDRCGIFSRDRDEEDGFRSETVRRVSER
jgi:hypothetical protein